MEEPRSKNKSGRRTATVVAALLVVALLLSGTYAWIDVKQHSTNPFRSEERINVRLNDKFDPPDDWKVDEPVKKEISVTNLDTSNRSVFVALQLKEYMEAYKLLPIQEKGENVLFATYADGAKKGQFMKWEDAVAGKFKYSKYTVNGVDYARTTSEELRNGIYGKSMEIMSETPAIYGTADKAGYEHKEQQTGECNYNLHKWGGQSIENRINSSDTIADYIVWWDNVLDIEVWKKIGKPKDVWVANGKVGGSIVFWSSPLAPGQSTKNLLDKVTLTAMPGAKLEYIIHVEMQAMTFDSVSMYEDSTPLSHTNIKFGVSEEYYHELKNLLEDAEI